MMDGEEHRQRCILRSTWQLASVFHFFNVFRPVLHFNIKFSMEDMESALLAPNDLLADIHIGLLKAIPPTIKNPITHNTWVAALHQKLKEWWHAVADGPLPLAPRDGDGMMTYLDLSPNVRVLLLKALCEARLDQEDMRAFISEMAKEKTSFLSIRKERTGTDMQGATYWYESDPVAGYRLYRESQSCNGKDKIKLRRGQLVSAPALVHWETLATNLNEFQSVAERLCSSNNEVEFVLGNKINSDIVPELVNAEKKKERALKKQLREASLLDIDLRVDSIANSRPRRERKPVSYTYDDYDNSILEAIDLMKGGHASSAITDDRSSSSEDEEEYDSAGKKEHESATPSKDNIVQSSKSEFSPDDCSSRRGIGTNIDFNNLQQSDVDTSSDWDEKENFLIVDSKSLLLNGNGPSHVAKNPKESAALNSRATRSKSLKDENHIFVCRG